MISKNDLPTTSYSTTHRGVKAYRATGGTKILLVNEKLAKFHDTKIKDLGSFARRKFDNLLFLTHSQRNRVRIIYE